jgi:ribosomal protein L37AE/L43A
MSAAAAMATVEAQRLCAQDDFVRSADAIWTCMRCIVTRILAQGYPVILQSVQCEVETTRVSGPCSSISTCSLAVTTMVYP